MDVFLSLRTHNSSLEGATKLMFCLGGVLYVLGNVIPYYYFQSEVGEDSSQGGEDSPP